MSVQFHRWRLGFKQYSLYHITRALQNNTFSTYQCSLLFQYAIFPANFHFKVNWIAQKYPFELFSTLWRMQYCVLRRTIYLHNSNVYIGDSKASIMPNSFKRCRL